METNKIISIRGKDYNVSFPNVGQMMDIESTKISYTNGKYVDMAMSILSNHTFALDVADSVSYFSVLIPDLKKDLNIQNWRNVDAFLAKELVKTYKNDFIPWFKPLLDDLYNYNDEEQPEEKSEKEDN